MLLKSTSFLVILAFVGNANTKDCGADVDESAFLAACAVLRNQQVEVV